MVSFWSVSVVRSFPVVCKQKERNNLREAIITFIKARVEEDVEHVSYKGLLFKYFHMFDADQDQMLDTMEFVKMVEKDMTESEVNDVLNFWLG